MSHLLYSNTRYLLGALANLVGKSPHHKSNSVPSSPIPFSDYPPLSLSTDIKSLLNNAAVYDIGMINEEFGMQMSVKSDHCDDKSTIEITNAVARSVVGILKKRLRLNQSKNNNGQNLSNSVDSAQPSLRRVRSTSDVTNPAIDHSARVLVIGASADLRAKHIAKMRGFPSIPLQLQQSQLRRSDSPVPPSSSSSPITTSVSSDSLSTLHQSMPHLNLPPSPVEKNFSNLSSAVYWTDQLELLAEIPSESFDAVLVFNSSGFINHQSTGIQLLESVHRILRKGGALAGTGLFKGFMNDNNNAGLPFVERNEESSLALPVHWSLKSFRDATESTGFFMHEINDLSTSAMVTLQLNRKTSSIEKQITSFVRSGKVVCSRFMACKLNESNDWNDEQRTVAVKCLSPLIKGIEGGAVTPAGAFSITRPLSMRSLSISTSSRTAFSPEDLSPELSFRNGVVVSGVSLGLPNGLDPDRPLFDAGNFRRLINGENMISQLTKNDKDRMRDMNVVQMVKSADGHRIKVRLTRDSELISVAGKIGKFDLSKEYGVPNHLIEAMDYTYQLAVAAGLEALADAGISILERDESGAVKSFSGLPEEMRDTTGVIFASSFPCIDSITQEVTRCAAARTRHEIMEMMKSKSSSDAVDQEQTQEYEYDRKLLFKLLVMGNCQLAELVKARGPNTHINAACAGTTQAVAIAQDWIRCGRAERVIIISADNASSDTLMPLVGTGFTALGAASVAPTVAEASVPFDKRRNGMILGAGAVGLVLEAHQFGVPHSVFGDGVEIVDSQMANSAFHACLMDKAHIAQQLNIFLDRIERQHGISRSILANNMIYMAHETGTHAGGGCAKAELDALAGAFGTDYSNVLITNTKGFTGHPMGVAFEDVMSVWSLRHGQLPPIANYREADTKYLPANTQLSINGGYHDRTFVLRFAAGFGSQLVYVLYRKVH